MLLATTLPMGNLRVFGLAVEAKGPRQGTTPHRVVVMVFPTSKREHSKVPILSDKLPTSVTYHESSTTLRILSHPLQLIRIKDNSVAYKEWSPTGATINTMPGIRFNHQLADQHNCISLRRIALRFCPQPSTLRCPSLFVCND